MPSWVDRVIHSLSYDTVALITIKNWKLGLLHRILQVAILTYIIGWSLIYQKSYQTSDEVVGSADIKIKGAAWLSDSSSPLQVLDATDLVVPGTERDATFLTTAIIDTANQTRGLCSWLDPSNACTRGCVLGRQMSVGVQTGQCDSDSGYCELAGWCPMELDTAPVVLQGIVNFTVFIRLNVQFPNFGHTLDNTGDTNSTTTGVNLWTVGDIIREAGLIDHWDAVKKSGAIIALRSIWNCDFDASSRCHPTYQWSRIDNPSSSLSVGFNFRDAHYYDNGERRDQTKRYGLRLVVLISGKGSKFGLVPLLTSIGAGLGLLSIATVIGDITAVYLLGKRSLYYKKNKFKEVRDDPNAIRQATDDDGVSDLESPMSPMSTWNQPFVSSSQQRINDGRESFD